VEHAENSHVHDVGHAAPEATNAVPVARLWIAGCCGYLSLGAALQQLPGFVPRRFGVGATLVGVVIGIASLSSALCRPAAGRLADAGRARTSIMIGAACGVVGGLGHLWSPDLGLLIVARLLLGAGEGAVFSAAIGWVVRGSAPERRGSRAGWFGLSMWGGLALGPVLAVALHAVGGYDAVWIAVAGLPAITFALATSTRAGSREPEPAHATAPAQRDRGAWRSMMPAEAWLPGLDFGLASFGYGAVNAILLLRLRHTGLGGESFALPVFAIAFLASRLFSSALVRRFDGAPIVVATTLVEALGLALAGLSSTLAGVLVGTAITGVGLGSLYPAMVVVIVRRGRHETQAAALAVMTSFWDLGLVVAGPVCGALAETAGFTLAFVMAAVLACAAAVLVVPASRPRARSERG
jgi:MFS family permease